MKKQTHRPPMWANKPAYRALNFLIQAEGVVAQSNPRLAEQIRAAMLRVAYGGRA